MLIMIYIVRATIHAVQKTNTDDSRTMAHIIRIAYFDWTGISWCSMHSYHGQTTELSVNLCVSPNSHKF